MQKRHGRGRDTETLPMTTADTPSPGPHKYGVHRRRWKKHLNPKILLLCKVAALCIVGFVLYKVGHFRPSSKEQVEERASVGKHGNHRTVDDVSSNLNRGANEADEVNKYHRFEASDGGELPLSQFKSLSYALAHTDLLGLYFAASWCPMSTPVTKALAVAFSDKAQTPLLSLGEGDSGGETEKRPLALVYVSSDNSEEEMKGYSKNGWINVPYDSNERSDIKRHFRVCAKKELNELGFQRKFEIPTLIIIDSVSRGIITTNGASDLREYGEKALKHWMGLRQLIGGLEEKYEREEEGRQKKPEPRIV